MCGIVGYIGKQQAYPILIKGLHQLEYRGYDSAGIALINEQHQLNVYKSKGKVSALENFISKKDITGSIGIAHTRWATHGEPNDVNAHPHYSNSESLALIHNGIIENYLPLKEMLIQQGYKFHSATDTEVIVNLIEYIKQSGKHTLIQSVQLALQQLIGAYAIAIIDKANPNQIIATRKSSPLAIGIGEDEFFLASDAAPIIAYTKDVVYLNDDEIAIINRNEKLKVVDITNVEKTPDIKKLEMSVHELEKGNFPHFMLKEIFEQSKTILSATRGRINVEATDIKLSGVIDHKEKFVNAKRIIFVACGTSWHAALIGEHLVEDYCKIPVEVEYASEFRYRNPIIYKDDIVIAISQSGETADTLAALEYARNKGAFTYGVCNVVGSSIARNTDSGSYIHVGPEIGVASTKAFTGQVITLTMLALAIAKERQTITQEELEKVLHEIQSIPSKIEAIYLQSENIRSFCIVYTYAKNFIYLGRGYNYPSALEGALKLKEISYIHAEGYPAAEMKHGPIALIDDEMPVVVIATSNRQYDKIISNIQEIKARKGKIIAIINNDDNEVRKLADYIIEIPKTIESLDPLLVAIPLQLFAYYIATYKGKDVDQPRNLAKSVTVE